MHQRCFDAVCSKVLSKYFFYIIYKNILVYFNKCCAKNNSLSYLKQEGGVWGSTTLWSHPPRGLLLIASFNSAGNRLTSPWNICNFRSPLESLCNHWALQPPPSRSRGESCCCCFCLAILCIYFFPFVVTAFKFEVRCP